MVYIAIFVSFVTKSVHIEVVTSQSTEAYLAALRRFIARRGKPRTICSDNGTNFQGAAIQLHAKLICFNPHHKYQQYRKSRPLKVGNGKSFHHMDLTSEDYGKQQ